jgi:hypothetical protein
VVHAGFAYEIGAAEGGWRRFDCVGLQSANLGTQRLSRLDTPTSRLVIRFNPFADSTS